MKISQVTDKLKEAHGDKFVTTVDDLIDGERIPTGIWPLDYATGGGLPMGMVSILWGLESSGKTNLALKAMANFQKMEPKKTCIFVDIEHSFDPSWAMRLGVDVNPKKFQIIRPHYGEMAVDIVQSLLMADDCGVLIFDSVGALTTKNTQESTSEKASVGGAAKLMTTMMNKIVPALNFAAMKENYPTPIIINQMRQKIGIMFGNPDTMPGGIALKHHSALTLKVYGSDESAKDDPNITAFKKITGSIAKTKIKTCQKKFEFLFPITNTGGRKIGYIDDWNTISSQMKDLGWLTKLTKTVKCLDQEYPTYKAAREALYANPDTIQAVRQAILDKRFEIIYGNVDS